MGAPAKTSLQPIHRNPPRKQRQVQATSTDAQGRSLTFSGLPHAQNCISRGSLRYVPEDR